MFVFKLFSVILTVQVVWTLTMIEETFLTNQLMDFFDDESIETKSEIIASANQKREAVAISSGEERFASLFSSVNLTDRANHYWTRKRGREKTTPPQMVWDIYYTLYPTRYPLMSNIVSDKSSLKKKREAIDKLLRLNKVSSRKKREVEDAVEEDTKSEKETTDDGSKLSEMAGNKTPEKSKWGRFGRKLKPCCESESDSIGLNQTLLSAKAQCMTEARKSMKKFNASEDTIDGNGGLYNMFSCERTNRWKTMVTCSIDCVSHKIGMFDLKGVINVEVAKRIIIENFAKQTWEQDASNVLVEKCSKTVMKSTSKDIDAFGLACSSKAAEFAYCVWREMFLTCPEDKQEKTKACEKLRSVLTKFDENKFKN